MRLFRKKNEGPSNDALINLIIAACEDPKLEQQLIGILSQNAFNRESLLNTLISELTLQRAPANLIAALERLKDDDIARKTGEFLGIEPI